MVLYELFTRTPPFDASIMEPAYIRNQGLDNRKCQTDIVSQKLRPPFPLSPPLHDDISMLIQRFFFFLFPLPLPLPLLFYTFFNFPFPDVGPKKPKIAQVWEGWWTGWKGCLKTQKKKKRGRFRHLCLLQYLQKQHFQKQQQGFIF